MSRETSRLIRRLHAEKELQEWFAALTAKGHELSPGERDAISQMLTLIIQRKAGSARLISYRTAVAKVRKHMDHIQARLIGIHKLNILKSDHASILIKIVLPLAVFYRVAEETEWYIDLACDAVSEDPRGVGAPWDELSWVARLPTRREVEKAMQALEEIACKRLRSLPPQASSMQALLFHGTETVAPLAKRHVLVKVVSEEAKRLEGRLLGHCLDGGSDDYDEIYSVRRCDGHPLYTLNIASGDVLTDIAGKRGSRVDLCANRLVREALAVLGVSKLRGRAISEENLRSSSSQAFLKLYQKLSPLDVYWSEGRFFYSADLTACKMPVCVTEQDLGGVELSEVLSLRLPKGDPLVGDFINGLLPRIRLAGKKMLGDTAAWAAQHQVFDAASRLLEGGARVTPSAFEALLKTRHPDLIALAITHRWGRHVARRKNLLSAVRWGSEVAVDTLLRSGEWEGEVLGDAVSVAAVHGHPRILERILEDGSIPDESWDAALNLAAEQGHIEVMQCLFSRRQVVPGDKALFKPLCKAANQGKFAAVKYLLELDGSQKNINAAFCHAAEGGYTQTLKEIMQTYEVSAKGYADALLDAAAGGHYEALRFLLKQRVDTKESLLSQQWALHLAARFSHLGILTGLLNHGLITPADIEEAYQKAKDARCNAACRLLAAASPTFHPTKSASNVEDEEVPHDEG